MSEPATTTHLSEGRANNHRHGTRARLAIRGHSGSALAVQETGAGAMVVKSAPPGPASERLERQIAKQRRALAENDLAYVRIPAVLDETWSEGGYSATMEYVYFQDPVQYFNSVPVTGIERLEEMLLGFVTAAVDRSPLQVVSMDPFHAKVHDIARSLENGTRYYDYLDHLRRLDRHLESEGTVEMPVGSCHGDLTMSNVLMAQDSSAIALVDFLDSFIDSPLVDLAKLRQDTSFHWTMLMTEQPMDRVRFVQLMGHMDAVIERAYRAHDWYASAIDWMMILNLLRIAPYATSDAVHEFLLSSLSQVRIQTNP